MLSYYPEDPHAKKLKQTLQAIRQAHIYEVSSEKIIEDLTTAATNDPDNATAIALIKIEILVKATFNQSISRENQKQNARQAIETTKKLLLFI